MENRAYIVSNAHLDTVWRWDIAKTVNEYIPDTLSKNFDLLEKYPSYRFNFEGAYRYDLIKTFYPKAFEIIREYASQGRWIPAGTAYETGDLNIPSPESIIRNLTLGRLCFSRNFKYMSKELFIPDCFGISYTTPSILAGSGIKGVTTQKLSWGGAYGIPFDLGILEGPDKSRVYASLNAKSYRYKFTDDIRGDLSVIDRIADNAGRAKLPWANHLYGTGDWGGAPTEESVAALEKSVIENKNRPEFQVYSAAAADVFDALDGLDKESKALLPVWNNELVMTNHGAGCYTSRAMSKKLNAQCEMMGLAAEQACLIATLIGDFKYPLELIQEAWKDVVKHQFHDDITGTSTMQVYNDSWADYYRSLFRFKTEYQAASSRIIRGLDTSWVDKSSVAVVVNNPTQFERSECVEIRIRSVVNCKNVRVFDRSGKEVPSQLVAKNGKQLTVVFRADMKSYSYKVYEIRKSEEPCRLDTGVKINGHTLENNKYKLIFNKNGDIAYLYDKKLKRQIISSPIKMAMLRDVGAMSYPSWEIRKDDLDREPYCYANTPEFTIVEDGPARVRMKIVRQAEFSTIVQLVTLSADSEIIEVKNIVDWRTRRTLLKAVFPLASRNEKAVYDLGIGVIERGNNTEKLHEVPAQKWAEITDSKENFGVAILSDCKYGWDKPDNNTLRLSCIHTPSGAFTKDARQDLQDLGRNVFSFAIYSHEGDFSNGNTKQAEMFTRPLLVMQTNARFNYTRFSDEESYLAINNDNALIKCFKGSESNDDKVIRVYETSGKAQKGVKITTFKPIKLMCEATHTEYHGKSITPVSEDGNRSFVFDLKPFEVKTFCIKFDVSHKDKAKRVLYTPKRLSYNAQGFTADEDMRHVILQGSGFSLPAEEMPTTICANGIYFDFFQKKSDSANDVMICRGQTVKVRDNDTRLYFLAASMHGTQELSILCGKKKNIVKIKPVSEPLSRWDMAGLNQVAEVYDGNNMRAGLDFRHTHHPEGNRVDRAYFNIYSVNVTDCNEVVFCENNKVVVLAVTATSEDCYSELVTKIEDSPTSKYQFDSNIPPIDKIIDKADFVTIRAGKIQEQMESGKGKGFRRSNIVTNIIRSYTKSEW